MTHFALDKSAVVSATVPKFAESSTSLIIAEMGDVLIKPQCGGHHYRAARHLRNSIIFAGGDHVDQSREADPADALGDPQLREVRQDRIPQPRTMRDQHGSGSMQRR